MTSDAASLDDSDSGYRLGAGARWMVLPWNNGGLEINGRVEYIDLDTRLASDDTAVGWELGARVHLLRLFSVGLEYAILEDDDQISGNLRVSF